jgi:hypothetical protein
MNYYYTIIAIVYLIHINPMMTVSAESRFMSEKVFISFALTVIIENNCCKNNRNIH